jgi:hypothetical protein
MGLPGLRLPLLQQGVVEFKKTADGESSEIAEELDDSIACDEPG